MCIFRYREGKGENDMNVPQKTKLAKKDILTIIAMLALVSFIFRLWPVIILMIVGLFVALVILL